MLDWRPFRAEGCAFPCNKTSGVIAVSLIGVIGNGGREKRSKEGGAGAHRRGTRERDAQEERRDLGRSRACRDWEIDIWLARSEELATSSLKIGDRCENGREE